ncbi:hypothetical protein RVBP14_0540 [Pseudomonas phage sp. Brmt]|nr:hypothetical protein RVBP14_0540 [Pseudomonas phage sp. Brmt]
MNKMLNFLNRTLYSGTEKVSSKATPSLEHFKTNVEQVDKKILQPFSTKFKTILKECYSNEEWVEEQSFIEEPIDLGSAARGLTERGIMRGDWGRLAHSTIKEAEGMMRTYSGRLNEDMEASEINEVIQDMPYNFTAGSANTSRLEEDDSIFVEADTTVVEPLSKQTLPKVAELTNQLVEVYNRITEEFTETGIAKVEQVEQPAVLLALGEIISSFNKLIDLSCGALPVEETVIVEEDPLPAIVTGPTTEPIDGEILPVDAINNSAALEEFIEEVLSTNPEFIKYQSMNDSNIDSYLTGDDWIILKFKDGSYYLYNAQSAGETNIEIMKDMAETGSGLNGFINRVIRGGYVEKSIINTPGFIQVSNEGLIDSIKKVLGISNRGDQKRIWRSSSSARGFLEQLESTFGNPQWLNKQVFVTGDINSNGIANVLSINGKVSIEDAIRAVEPFFKLEEKSNREMESYRQKTKPALDLLIKNAHNLDANVYKEAKAIVDKARAGFKTSVKWPAGTITGKGTYNSPRTVVAKYPSTDSKLKALTEEEAAKAMNLIISALERQITLSFKFPDLPDPLEGLIYDMLDNPSPIAGIDYYDWNDLLFACFGPGIDDDVMEVNKMRQYHSFIDIMEAAAKWVDRSIKGRLAMGNENYQ